VDLSRRDFLKGAAVAVGALALPVAAEACVPPKLIEVGWHTPEPAALLPSLAQYEAVAPFDGLVLVLRNNNLSCHLLKSMGFCLTLTVKSPISPQEEPAHGRQHYHDVLSV
jgi:hypothetical protein